MESMGNVERREKGKRSRMAKEGTTDMVSELDGNKNRHKPSLSSFFDLSITLPLFNLNWG